MWLLFDLPSEEGMLHSVMSFLLAFGLASLFLGAIDAEAFPDFLARSFTRLKRIGEGIGIFSTWVCWILVLGPTLPLIIACSYMMIFEVGEEDLKRGTPLLYNLGGIFLCLFCLYVIFILPSGYRCGVIKKRVRWIWTYFGKDVRVRDFNNVRIVEYALGNGGGGGPVVTIEYDGGPEGRRKKRLKFRNLYKLSREEFGDILSEFLGEPERRTVVPTSWGGTPRLVEDG